MSKKQLAASTIARVMSEMGSKGGLKRANKLTAKRRIEIARMGGQAKAKLAAKI